MDTDVRQPTHMSARSSPLRNHRIARGWTLAEAAAKAAMDLSHLSKVERGLAGLSVETLARLARAYGLADLEELLAPYVRETVG